MDFELFIRGIIVVFYMVHTVCHFLPRHPSIPVHYRYHHLRKTQGQYAIGQLLPTQNIYLPMQYVYIFDYQ